MSNFILMGCSGTFTYDSCVKIKDILINMLKPTQLVKNHSCRCVSHSYFPLPYASEEKTGRVKKSDILILCVSLEST